MSDCGCDVPGFNNPGQLPAVTTADNGDVLEVVGGVWAKAAAAPGTLPAVGAADNDDLLAVVAGAWAKAGPAFIIRANLAALTAQDKADLPNGCQAYVVAEQQIYQLDTANPLTTSSPLIVARGAGAGKWYRKSRAYVVGNFTLWCQAFGFGVVGFTPGQYAVSNANAPDIVLSMPDLVGAVGEQDIMIDNLGNLWLTSNVAGAGPISIKKYLLKDCLQSGVPTAVLTLTPPINTATGQSECGCSIFDHDGGLWTMNGDHGTFGVSAFARYGNKAYEINSGIPGIKTKLFNPGAIVPSTSNQQDMVFDGQGNLWCTVAFTGDLAGVNGGIFMLSASQLTNDASVVPSLFWHGSNFGNVIGLLARQLAIGPTGLIWTSNITSNKIEVWDPTNAVSGNPAPTIVLTSASFNGCFGLAFDDSGNLWVQNGNDNNLMRIPAASLTASGVVVPDIILSQVTVGTTNKITFPRNPDRSGLQPSGAPITP